MMQHLALIMDGNRRWAKQHGLMSWQGHRQGAKTVEMVLQYCLDNKISYVSLYTFSIENFKRTPQEIEYLFSLIQESVDRSNEFVKNGVKVRFIGDLSMLPQKTKNACIELMQSTQQGKALTCNFLICYGGQQEIVAGVQKAIECGVTLINVDTLKSYLWMHDTPEPELVIRTGGVKRLSNFLLFHAAYSEIRFLDCLWPDLTKEMLDQVVQESLLVTKNFGS